MKYGHFDEAAHEYVIDRVDTPASWTNYLGTKDFATVIAHHGGGYSYYKDAQQGRVTRYRQNGVPMDRPGKYVYLTDAASGDFWSIPWQPVGKPLDSGTWTAAHGMGYTRFESTYRGISAMHTVFIPLDDDCEVWDVRIVNTGDESRTLTVTGYVEFSFHNVEIDNQNLQMSLYCQGADYADGVIECDAFYEPWTEHFFSSRLGTHDPTLPDAFDCLRDAFIGPYRTETNPLGVERGLTGSQGTTQNHCGALAHRVTLNPGEEARIVFLLGHGSRDAAGLALRATYTPDHVDAEYQRLLDYWAEKRSRFQVSTPSEGMNSMLNTWTLLQAETCVVWSRFASFVEVGGRSGLGFRDTAQDAAAVIHSNPETSRQRIVELLRAQTEAGYGLHLFEPSDFDPQPVNKPGFLTPTVVPRAEGASLIHGLKDTCSDDHLWLPFTVAQYVYETGDAAFLDSEIPFAEAAAAAAGTGNAAPGHTVWEHLERALTFTSEHIGPTGVALGLRADWNDCLNLGGGESALVTFLHAWAIRCYLDLAEAVGHTDQTGHTGYPVNPVNTRTWTAELERISQVATTELWDGSWWRRGVTSQGVLIGTTTNAEGKMFLEHQAWPTIAGIATPEQSVATLDSIHQHLASEYGMHLEWPAYTQVDDTVGFLTRVYPGIKENAAIFSHPNAWPIIAEAILGRGDQAMALYEAICPWTHNDAIEVREAEPYAYVQFLYGRDHPRYGLGQNPWLTGTAGWMYTAATKYILGIRPGMRGLTIDPCIPTDWDGFEVTRQWRGATYHITVTNAQHVSRGKVSVTVNGQSHPSDQPIPLFDEGARVTVSVELG
ncbi:MAG: N,N'-diacetylchitobiose phosphorylase [Cellulomonadaceae bacterium]|jgi:N,N'-diacetylchitobiose phosphorylase|nr:N,N'-diacetylchitobiose phosphorylase [Cellulomonadaceae bacterium]